MSNLALRSEVQTQRCDDAEHRIASIADTCQNVLAWLITKADGAALIYGGLDPQLPNDLVDLLGAKASDVFAKLDESGKLQLQYLKITLANRSKVQLLVDMLDANTKCKLNDALLDMYLEQYPSFESSNISFTLIDFTTDIIRYAHLPPPPYGTPRAMDRPPAHVARANHVNPFNTSSDGSSGATLAYATHANFPNTVNAGSEGTSAGDSTKIESIVQSMDREAEFQHHPQTPPSRESAAVPSPIMPGPPLHNPQGVAARSGAQLTRSRGPGSPLGPSPRQTPGRSYPTTQQQTPARSGQRTPATPLIQSFSSTAIDVEATPSVSRSARGPLPRVPTGSEPQSPSPAPSRDIDVSSALEAAVPSTPPLVGALTTEGVLHYLPHQGPCEYDDEPITFTGSKTCCHCPSLTGQPGRPCVQEEWSLTLQTRLAPPAQLPPDHPSATHLGAIYTFTIHVLALLVAAVVKDRLNHLLSFSG